MSVSYTWIINSFSLRPEEMGENLRSPTFPAKADDDIKWYLELYPKGEREESKDYLSLYLRLMSSNKSEVTAKYLFSAVNDKSKKIKTMKSSGGIRFVRRSGWGFSKFLSREFCLDKANGLLSDDKLTIVCEISFPENSFVIFGPSNAAPFKLPECRLCDDLSILFESQKFSDVTLLAGEQEFQVHKAILAARSSVFAAMFEHEMKEKIQNRVEISDIDQEVLREVLRFIYTGNAVNFEKMADKLLGAADKYGLGRLKRMCEETLYKNLSTENAADVLVLADFYSIDQLKAQAIDFITINATDVMDTDNWKSITQSHPHLITEVSRALAIACSSYKATVQVLETKLKKASGSSRQS